MKKFVLIVLIFVFCFSLLATHSVKAEKRMPVIQIALLLDTSNSMDGLIDQAKSQLWKFVNELAEAKLNNDEPMFYAALYEYGNSGLSARDGYIRQVTPFTYNLDKISEELFSLKTNGGSEYCGQVIKASTDALKWTNDKTDLRMIFIAGNEPFTQGDVSYVDAAKGAKNKGITVNTIFCGPYTRGIDTKWKDGANITGGDYMNIDQDRKAVHIPAPQDDRIEALGLALNKTYLPYGSEGKKGYALQAAQESNVKSAGKGSVIQRSVAKASPYYKSSGWDLVDAAKDKKFKLAEVKKDQLPKEMQKMTLAQKKKHIATQAAKREKIQKDIKELNTKRKKFVAKDMKELAKKGQKDTLDAAMIKSLRKQAEKKGFKFK